MNARRGAAGAALTVFIACGSASAPQARPVGRVVEAATASGQYLYSFDPSGLPTSVGTSGASYAIARQGSTLTAGTSVYGYDSLGRVTSIDAMVLSYGPDGQIAEASNGNVTESYLYDEYGQRILKSTNGVPAAAFVDEGTVTASDLDEPVRVAGVLAGLIKNGSFVFAAADVRGTVQADSDGTQRLASPFGARAVHPDVSATIDFAASEYDADLGTERMGVRDYDARIAQFLQPDPHFLEHPEECVKSPVECSLYGYARSNPTTFVDPTGTAGDKPEAETAAAGSDDSKTQSESFTMTGYYMHTSPNAEGTVPLMDPDGNTIANVSPAFWLKASMEGSARLSDGRYVNVSGGKVDVDSDKYAQVWDKAQTLFKTKVKEGKVGQLGLGMENGQVVRANAFEVTTGPLDSHGHVLVPYRSIAADPAVFAQGTRVQIQELVGRALPDGTKHDGWVTVVDVGGAKKGATIDLFVGDEAQSKAVTMPVHIKR
jgi:RHS repeat-associated protein